MRARDSYFLTDSIVAPIITRLTSKGQFTLPRRLREALGVEPGDYVALTPTAGGVLISAAEVAARKPQGEALMALVRSLGERLEDEGIVEEEQLDEAVAASKREVYRRRYGGRSG